MSYQKQERTRDRESTGYPEYPKYSRYLEHPRYAKPTKSTKPTKPINPTKLKRRQKHPVIKATILAFTVLAIGIICTQTLWKEFVEATVANSQNNEHSGASALSKSIYDGQVSSDLPELTVPLSLTEVDDTRYLQLINHDYPITGDSDKSQMVSVWPSILVVDKDIVLHNEALEAVTNLINAAREEGVVDFCITSGYRDYNQQVQAYNEAHDKTTVQMPNHSEHQTGLAIDIGVVGVSQSEMAGSQQGRWLAKNAWRFGLIVRYSEDKQGITGIADEPWHLRYVGQPHAWYCWEMNLCYEEYVQFLKDSGGYSVTLEGRTYSVVYEWPESGLIYVPEDLNYYLSSDNTGGYIITAWE